MVYRHVVSVVDVTPEFGSKSKAFTYKASCDSDEDEDEEIVQGMWGLSFQSEEEEELSSMDSDGTDQDDISPSGSPVPDDAGSEYWIYSVIKDFLVLCRNIGLQNE